MDATSGRSASTIVVFISCMHVIHTNYGSSTHPQGGPKAELTTDHGTYFFFVTSAEGLNTTCK